MRMSRSFKCQDVRAAGSLFPHKMSFVELEKEETVKQMAKQWFGDSNCVKLHQI